MEKNLLKPETIQKIIFTFRESQVMLDRDLAELYDVETRRLNEQANEMQIDFPEDTVFS